MKNELFSELLKLRAKQRVPSSDQQSLFYSTEFATKTLCLSLKLGKEDLD
jgi:hypothetical protein